MTAELAGGDSDNRGRRWRPVYLFVIGIVVGGLVWSIWGQEESPDTGPSQQPVAADSLGSVDSSFTAARDDSRENSRPNVNETITDQRRTAVVKAAEVIGPAVVSISVVQTRYVRGRHRADPFGFFDRYLLGPIYRERVPSLGSGFIIDRAGIILTNEHVVHDAEQIKVTLTDGRNFDAKLIGSDPNYDLAVLKIDGDDLPIATLAESDDILIGEWVIALGNPFGYLLNEYQPSVTVGVVSAKGRDIKPTGGTTGIYKNMIQTDAAINPGNSGGPLVNGEGRVIGINTFIFTESGGSLGIGFAIPIGVADRVVREILQYGEVRQVWTGMLVREISPHMAAYYGIRNAQGLIIWELEEGSPADRADVRVGDIIREVNGEPISKTAQATRLIFGASVGDVIQLTLERAGEFREVEIRLEERPRQGNRSQ